MKNEKDEHIDVCGKQTHVRYSDILIKRFCPVKKNNILYLIVNQLYILKLSRKESYWTSICLCYLCAHTSN